MKRYLAVFAATIVATAAVHELGHAVAGWVQGVAVVPTPFKEYVLRAELPWPLYQWIAFGGPLGTLLTVVGAGAWYVRRPSPSADAAFAGVLLTPAAYSLRYLVAGRGHDGLEWQAAQSALGLQATGHTLDIALCGIVALGGAVWIARCHRSLRWSDGAKALGLFVLGVAVLVLCQVGNNALFDGAFPQVRVTDVPSEVLASGEQH